MPQMKEMCTVQKIKGKYRSINPEGNLEVGLKGEASQQKIRRSGFEVRNVRPGQQR